MNSIDKETSIAPNLSKPNEADYSERSTYAQFIQPKGADYWVGYDGSDFDHSDHMVILTDDNELAEFNKYDVAIEDYELFRKSMVVLNEMIALLPSGNLQKGIRSAIEAKCIDLLAAARESRQNNNYAFSLEEIHYVQNDVSRLLRMISLSLGSDEKEKNLDAKMSPNQRVGEKFKNDGYHSVFDIELKDLDPFSYWASDSGRQKYVSFNANLGTLDIKIIPDERISFDYEPDSRLLAAGRYDSDTTVTIGNSGIQMKHHNEALCMRIDLDDNAPCGIALDLGRSPFSGTRIQRDGDLIGKIFSSISKNGCHEHTGFTPQMKDEFGGFAEELALKQHLFWITQQQGAQKSA